MLYHLTGVGNGKHSQNCAKLKFNKDKHIPKKDKQHSGGERNRGGQAFGKIATCFQNKNSNANYTLHWSVVWSLWASGWSLWTVTRCACVRLRAWHLSVRPAGSLQTTCHRPSAASSPLFVFVFSFLFVFLFVFARSLQTPCHRPSAASSPLCWSIVIIRILLETPICWKLLLSLYHHLGSFERVDVIYI